MIKRSECQCPCHHDGSIHCVPCCYPDNYVELHERQERLKTKQAAEIFEIFEKAQDDIANAFAVPEHLLKGKEK